jgi:hypothetical protein
MMSDRASPGEGGLPGLSGLPYYTDSLFRASAAPGAAASAPAGGAVPAPMAQAQISRIFVRSLQNQGMAPGDTQYVGQLVAQRTGMSQADAEKLVTDTYAKVQQAQAQAKEAADKARKAAAYAALWLFVSLLLGAFSASLLATYGGHRRDL